MIFLERSVEIMELIKIDDRDHVIFKVGDGVKPTGILLLDRRTGELKSLFVESKYRKKGVAKFLIKNALHFAHTLSLKTWARVNFENSISINMFKKLGFKEMIMFEEV